MDKIVYIEKKSFKGLKNYFTGSILYQEEDEIHVDSNGNNETDSEPKDDNKNIFNTH